MAKVDKTLIFVASKKVLGKAHTSNIQDLSNETVPSNVQASTQTTFGESVPNTVDTTTFFSIQSGTVEYIEFDVNSITGTDYDEDSFSGTGGSENSDNTFHGYYLSLPSNYESNSSNPSAGTGFFVNDSIVYNTRGKLQLVPPLLSNAASNKYNLTLYNQSGNRIFPGDEIDWTIDYYNGIVFVQDPQTDNVPTTARAFLYVGKFADEMITEASGSGGGISDVVDDTSPQLGGNLDVNGNDIVSVSNGDINLDPNGSGKVVFKGNATKGSGQFVLNCENNSHGIIVKGPPHSAGANYTLTLPNDDGNANQVLKTDGSGNTSWTDIVSFGRTEVTTTITSSVSDRILGVSASAGLEIRLPAASGYLAGQNFIIKDEAGNADSNNITIRTTGSDKIDGQSLIVLESPYAAVNLYSNGTDKFFIY